VLWVDPSRQLRPMQPLAHPHPVGWGERIRRVKVRKCVGRDEGNLVGKVKTVCTGKAKQGIHSLLPISRQVFSHFQESRVSARVTVAWENRLHASKCPFAPAFPPAEHKAIQYGISLWSVGVSCPGCVPSYLLVHPQPPCW